LLHRYEKIHTRNLRQEVFCTNWYANLLAKRAIFGSGETLLKVPTIGKFERFRNQNTFTIGSDGTNRFINPFRELIGAGFRSTFISSPWIPAVINKTGPWLF
jgi:hypothetical protein